MKTRFETSPEGEQIKVLTLDSGHVIRELFHEPSAADIRRAEIMARLATIDATGDKPRTARELRLGNAATLAWLKVLDDEAAALRADLARL